MSSSRSAIQARAASRNRSDRSSSTNTVLPVMRIGSRMSPESHFTRDLNAAIAPPASSSMTPSTKAVAEVFSKSVTITARMSCPRDCISVEMISESASILVAAYAIILPTGDAHGRIPVSVICIPSNRSRLVNISPFLWSSFSSDRRRPCCT